MENPNNSIHAENANVNVTHVHKLDWMAATLLMVLVLAVSIAGYQFGRDASAEVQRSKDYSTLQNHVRDMEKELGVVQGYKQIHESLEQERRDRNEQR